MRLHVLRIILLLLALLPGVALAQSAGATFTGILSITSGDPPRDSAGGGIRAELTLPDNTTYPLKLSGAQQGLAQQFYGRRVDVRGRMTGEAPATIVVETIGPAAPRGK